MATNLVSMVDSKRGTLNRHIFADKGLYAQELDQIFGRCWLFVGHETQIPKANDFSAAYMGEDPILVTHDSKRETACLPEYVPSQGQPHLPCRFRQHSIIHMHIAWLDIRNGRKACGSARIQRGVFRRAGPSEQNQRAYYARWAEVMDASSWADIKIAPRTNS